MAPSVSATRLATLMGGFDRYPAYAGLADAVVELVNAGRVPYGTRLPSERELVAALGVSRTTVGRAYAALRVSGYAEARQGAGTFARLPGGPERRHDRALRPRQLGEDAIDLSCAATSAPPGLAAAYAEATAGLVSYLGGTGYFPAGLPSLQAAVADQYAARGLPTDPEQVLIMPGALSATALVERTLGGPGSRVVVESPVYPNAAQALTHRGARLATAPVDPGGFDLASFRQVLTSTRADLAYLIPDFQNPTGHLMSEGQREELGAHLDRTQTVAIVDEAHQALALDGQPMPRPFACFSASAITVGSASKSFWGGLRLGWVRVPHGLIDDLTDARLGMDLGAPVLEQLVLARLLARGPVLAGHRERLREQRDALVAAIRSRLPVALPGAGRWTHAVVRAPPRRSHRAGRRGGAARGDDRAWPGVRASGRVRPVRAGALDAPGPRARRRCRPAGPGMVGGRGAACGCGPRRAPATPAPDRRLSAGRQPAAQDMSARSRPQVSEQVPPHRSDRAVAAAGASETSTSPRRAVAAHAPPGPA